MTPYDRQSDEIKMNALRNIAHLHHHARPVGAQRQAVTWCVLNICMENLPVMPVIFTNFLKLTPEKKGPLYEYTPDTGYICKENYD